MSPPKQALNVDFAALAIADPDFARIYTANDGFVDFQNPRTVLQLTKSILKRDFDLKLDLPSDRLCPPVPIRYEYIRWLQDLIDTTSNSYTDKFDPTRAVIGVDIGVGASCIYPLLGCASRSTWRFGGTEIDEKSFECARRNVVSNNMQSRIRLRRPDPRGPLLSLQALGIEQADFSMCNPPFFLSRQDMLATHMNKKRSPSAVCSGADVEMVTEGGDLGFVRRMIDESVSLQERVQWYSSMLGKLTSAHAVIERLKQVGVSNWAVTTLQAGNVTKRWAVAWSFGDVRPRNDVARRNMTTKTVLPFPTDSRFTVPETISELCTLRIRRRMDSLNLKWTWDDEKNTGLAFATANVWSRSARRKRQREDAAAAAAAAAAVAEVPERIVKLTIKEEVSDVEAALGVRITLVRNSTEVVVRWLKGNDVVLFESFCGMLKTCATNS